MTLNEQLIRLSSYKINFNIYEGTVIISLEYPKDWTILEINSSDIQTTSENGRQFYWVPLQMDVEKVFELIDETIEYNKDIEAKSELFKQKIDEMRKIFLEADLQTLRTMEFKMKKKKLPKKKVTEEKENNITEVNDAANGKQTQFENKQEEVITEPVKEENMVSLEETNSKVKEPTEIDKMIEQAVKEKQEKK
jgi:hypothetical protein